LTRTLLRRVEWRRRHSTNSPTAWLPAPVAGFFSRATRMLRKWTSDPSLCRARCPELGTHPVTLPAFLPLISTVNAPLRQVTTQVFHILGLVTRSLTLTMLSVLAPLCVRTLPALGACSWTWIDRGQILSGPPAGSGFVSRVASKRSPRHLAILIAETPPYTAILRESRHSIQQAVRA